MAQLLQHNSSAARALELKMWFNGTQYIIYLGGLPVNIKTGYATGGDDCEEEYIMDNSISQTEFCKDYRSAMQVFEAMRERYL